MPGQRKTDGCFLSSPVARPSCWPTAAPSTPRTSMPSSPSATRSSTNRCRHLPRKKARRWEVPVTKSTDDTPKGELILYQTEDGRTRIECRFEGETVWLTQALIADLFQTTPQNITPHLREIYAEGELNEAATCKAFLQVRTEGARQVSRNYPRRARPGPPPTPPTGRKRATGAPTWGCRPSSARPGQPGGGCLGPFQPLRRHDHGARPLL